MARFTALATAILILAGALVTSTGSGLSVPDWPLSFGTLFPPMVGGVRFEHTHRLIAGSVALLTILLAAMIWRGSSARLPRLLVTWAVVAVLLQALLGGLTVLLKLPLVVSAAHGTLAQTFFCMVVALAMFLSPAWRDALPREADREASRLRTLALVTTLAIWIQLVIAAVMRHMGAGLAIPDFPLAYGQWLPPFWTPMVAIHFAHRVMAVIVFGLAMATTVTVMRRAGRHSPPQGSGPSPGAPHFAAGGAGRRHHMVGATPPRDLAARGERGTRPRHQPGGRLVDSAPVEPGRGSWRR